MEPIVGIVERGDVPPTLEVDGVGLVLKFFAHSPVHLICTRSALLSFIEKSKESPVEIPYPSFKLVVGKNRVKITLTKPVSGHGTARFKKGEFLALLADDVSPL